MKIFIVGCAKSGTWLLLHLFYSFKNFEVINSDAEVPLSAVLTLPVSPGMNGVWKRTWDKIFSNHRSVFKEEIDVQLRKVRQQKIKLIYIRRDKSSVLKSDGGYVKEERYLDTEAQAEEFADDLAFVVNYDDLLANPDAVQTKLANALGLDITYRWSEYPDFVPDEAFAKREGRPNYSRRRIGAAYLRDTRH